MTERARIDLTGMCHFQKDARLVARIGMLETAWALAYPHVDIKKQMGWAHAWLISSGKKYQDMGKFLNNWMRFCEEKYAKEHPEGWTGQERRDGERRATAAKEEPWEPDLTMEEMIAIRKRNMGGK